MTTEPNDFPDPLLGIPLIPVPGEPGVYLDARALQRLLDLGGSLSVFVPDDVGQFKRDVSLLTPSGFMPIEPRFMILPENPPGVVESEDENVEMKDGKPAE